MRSPWYYKQTGANNQFKRKIALRQMGLAITLLLFINSFLAVATPHTPHKALKVAGIELTLITPFAIGTKGEDESEEDFKAREGKTEPADKFLARCIKHLDKQITKLEGKDGEIGKTLKELQEGLKKIQPDQDLLKNLKEEIAKTNLALEALKENRTKAAITKSVVDQITEWHTKHKDDITAIRSKQRRELAPLTIKVNTPMTPSNTYSAGTYLPQVEYLPGVTDIVRVEPTFWDYVKKGRVSSAALVWVNKYTPSGAADFIAPGVAKPGVSFKLQTETSNAKKVAVSAKTATELLDDIPGMQTFINQELEYALKYAINQALMSGTLSSTDPAGIQSLSVTFSATGIATPNPNNWDAIVAAVAQLRSGNLYGPVTAFVNPIDHANMMLAKAVSQGQYLVINGQQVPATIVEDNNIPVGYVQVALLDYYRIAIYQDMEITFGWEMDDFTKNLVTAVCELRLHQWFSANNTGAFIYDSFANIQAAIAAV